MINRAVLKRLMPKEAYVQPPPPPPPAEAALGATPPGMPPPGAGGPPPGMDPAAGMPPPGMDPAAGMPSPGALPPGVDPSMMAPPGMDTNAGMPPPPETPAAPDTVTMKYTDLKKMVDDAVRSKIIVDKFKELEKRIGFLENALGKKSAAANKALPEGEMSGGDLGSTEDAGPSLQLQGAPPDAARMPPLPPELAGLPPPPDMLPPGLPPLPPDAMPKMASAQVSPKALRLLAQLNYTLGKR